MKKSFGLMPIVVLAAVLLAVVAFAVGVTPLIYRAAVPPEVAASAVDQSSPAYLLSVPDSTRRGVRNPWSVASNGDLPIHPMYAAVFAVLAAFAIPLIVLFGMMRSGNKEVNKGNSELARTRAAGQSIAVSIKGGSAVDPWAEVGPRG